MADNEMGFDVSLDIDDEGSISKLKGELDLLMGTMRATSKQLNQFVRAQTKDINDSFNEAIKSGQGLEKVMRKLTATQSQVMNSQSRGTPLQQTNEAATKRVIAENFTKTDSAFQAALTDAWVKSMVRERKNTHEAILARVKKEFDAIDRMVAASADDIRDATVLRTSYRQSRLVKTTTPEYMAAQANSDNARDTKFVRQNTDADLMRANVTADELSNLRKIARYNTEEGRLAEQRLAEIAQRNRLFKAQNDLDKFEQRALSEAYKAANADYLAAKERLAQINKQKLIAKVNAIDNPPPAPVVTVDAEVEAAKARLNQIKRENLIYDGTNKRSKAEQDAAKEQEKAANAELLAARERLKVANEQRTIARAKALDTPAAVKPQTAVERANITAQEMANLRKLRQFNTAEGIAAEKRLAEIAYEDRLFQARNRITKEEQLALKEREKAANAEYLDAKERLRVANQQKTIDRANNLGVPKPVTEKPGLFDGVNARFNSNGGADIMAIQARLMAGYQALNLFFSAVRNGAAFVVQLDTELKQFQAITNTSTASMVAFKDQLVEVAQNTKFSAVELAQAATTMGQAGLSAKEVGDTLGSVALLATASGSDLSAAVDVVTSSMSIFNLRTSEAADLANTLTASLNLSKLTIDKIALSMQYAGNIAAESGVGYKELLSIIGTMSNSGIMSGSTLGTGLRQLMIDIQNPTKKFKDALASVGLTEQDVSIRSKTLTGVLRTLHDAGFGTAQAFQSFEVRAASAFAAVDGNLDSITDMNQQLVNSTAALDANATQMESLSNKWSRLGSTAGLTLDAMFGSTMQGIKNVIDGLQSILQTINEYKPALSIIGTLFASAMSLLAVTQMIAVVRGLGIALAGMVGVAGEAKVAFLGLNLAMRANPVLLIVGGIITAISLFSQFGTSVETAADKLDRLKSEAEDAKGAVDATNQTIKGLSETADQLMAQRQALDNDPVLRKSRIEEVINAFKELSTEIDSSSSSVDNLSDAVSRLLSKQSQIKEGQLRLSEAKQKEIVDAQADILNKTQANNATDIYSRMSIDAQSGVSPEPGDSPAKIAKKISDSFKAQLPDQYDSLVEQATGQTAVTNLNELILKTGQLKQALKDMPAEGNEELRTTYATLLASLDRLIPQQQQYNGQVATLATIQKQVAQAALINTPQMKDFAERSNKLYGKAEDFKNETLGGKSPYTPEQQLKKVQDYKIDLQSKIDAMSREAEAAGSDVFESFKSNILPKLSESITTLDQIVSKRTEDYFKVRERSMRREDSSAGTRISALATRSSKASSQEMVEQLMNEVIDITNERRKALKELYAEKIYYADTQSEKDSLADELVQKLSEMSAQESAQIGGMLNRVDAIKEAQLRSLKTGLDDQVQALTTKINENVDALKKLNPGPAFDKLKASTQGLIDQLARISQQSGIVDLQLNNPNQLPPGIKPVASDANAQQRQAQVMAIYQNAGYTKEQAAGVVGHFMQESGVRADGPPGDNGQAQYLAQWHPDRQARLQSWLSDPSLNTTGATNDLNGQAMFSVYELKKYYPQVDEALRNAGSVQDAVKAFAPYEGFRDYNKPTVHAAEEYNARTANAVSAYSIDTSKLASVGALQTNLDQSNNPGVSRVTDQLIETAAQKLKTQLSQAKIGGDPQKILAMQDTIDQEYTDIIKQRTDEFKAKNPGVDPKLDTEFQSSLDEIGSQQLAKTSTLIDTYWSAVQEKGEKSVKLAQLKLDEAQKQPEGTYTADAMAKLQADVTVAQKAAQQEELAAATQLVARANTEAASAAALYGQNSDQVRYWSEQEAQAKQKVLEVTQQKTAADAAAAQQGPSVTQAIQSANQQWAIQNGLQQRNLAGQMQMVPLATQVGNAWGQVLTGMSDNLSTLFMNLAQGTMSAKDAFKAFALSTVQMFMQMIAKALAYQLIMSTIGGTSSGGGFLSQLLGVVSGGGTTGGGVAGSAIGEIVPGRLSTRDSVLRRVMPGEAILRSSAVKNLGRNNLRNLNSLGNRQLSPEGNPFLDQKNGDKGSNVVNVWVISPDQKPSMGPNDVIAIVGDNIQRRGPLKQLIKEVQMGR